MHFLICFGCDFFWGEIMDNGMPFMWTCFMMEDEMTTTKKIPLMKGFL
jgi:hypothetical protein